MLVPTTGRDMDQPAWLLDEDAVPDTPGHDHCLARSYLGVADPVIQLEPEPDAPTHQIRRGNTLRKRQGGTYASDRDRRQPSSARHHCSTRFLPGLSGPQR